MNSSVLIIGEDSFSTQILKRVRGLSTLSIETTRTIPDADNRLQQDPPELIVLQASLPNSQEFCSHLRQQRQLSWIYCILVDDCHLPTNGQAPQLMLDYMELVTPALDAGVDAYIWLPNDLTMGSATANHCERLLQAQIRNGLKRVQPYRELSRANDLLSAIALSDPLTRLSNRRAFDWELPRQIESARTQELPLSLLILDIDYFKEVNDRYGHLIGDKVLCMMAERLRNHMRFYETPFRYGGEEFVITLQNTTAEDAASVGRRLCQLISEQPFLINNDLDLSITISVGAASLNAQDDSNGTSLLDRADQNLLKAKQQGRNRVISDQEQLA